MKRFYLFLTVILFVGILFSCNANDEDEPNDDPIDVEVTLTIQTYLEDTEDMFEVYSFETNVPGPTVFVIGGVHGNERAGWMAAQTMLDYAFTRGTVHILPVAHRRTATSNPPRRVYSGWSDLNRAFPGDPTGTMVERLAYTIFTAIATTSPDVVLDLHESRYSYMNEGWIGDSIILHIADYSLYALEVLEHFNALPLQAGKTPFTYLNSPPVGSLNRTYSEFYQVPVFTIETNREALTTSIDSEQILLEVRIAQQIAMIEVFLKTFPDQS